MAINMLPHRRFPNYLELMPEPHTAYPEQRRISLADRVPDNYSKGRSRQLASLCTELTSSLQQILVPLQNGVAETHFCCSAYGGACRCEGGYDSMLSNSQSISSREESNTDRNESSDIVEMEHNAKVQANNDKNDNNQELQCLNKDDKTEKYSRPVTDHRKINRSSIRATKSAVTTTHIKTCHQEDKILFNVPRTITIFSDLHKNSNQISNATMGKPGEISGDLLIEIEGQCLNIQGQRAIKCLDKPWKLIKAMEMHSVRFNCINFNSVSPQFTQLRQRYPSIEEFIFRETNIYCLAQLNALAELQGISALTIEEDGNPIFAKDWRTYAIYRLAHWGLEKINGDVAADNMVKSAEQEFSGLSDIVLKSLPGDLLLPLIGRLTLEAGHPGPPPSAKEAKEWIYISADPNFRSVVAKEALQWKRGMSTQEEFTWRQRGRAYLSLVLELGSCAAEKLKLLNLEWQSILPELIQGAIVDFIYCDNYVRQCIENI